MKIVKAEVKTIYTLHVDFRDFVKVFTEAKEDPMCEIMSAFDNVDLDNTTLGYVSKVFRSQWDAETTRYIVRQLGFDGVENYGCFIEKDEVPSYHLLVVYNNGDTMN